MGNFKTTASSVLTVSNNTINPGTPLWGAYAVNALSVNSVNDAVQSATLAPSEISSNGDSSGEAWIYATAISGNNTVIGYGLQGQSAHPEEDREFNWGGELGVCFSGDFGGLLMPDGRRRIPSDGAAWFLFGVDVGTGRTPSVTSMACKRCFIR